MHQSTQYNEIHAAVINYLDTYFVERDLEQTLKMFSPNISGFGTGIDEKSHGTKQVRELYSRDIEQAPNPIHYEIINLNIHSPAQNSGIVFCELDIHTTIMEQELNLNNLRLSIFLQKEFDSWLIEHLHISFPTVEHEDDESYPVKELEERNKVLQRLVDEKTKTLKEANEKLEQALNEIKILQGIIPICTHCKSIRDDNKCWQKLETYIREHSDAQFSHSICPDCAKKYYPDLDLYKNEK